MKLHNPLDKLIYKEILPIIGVGVTILTFIAFSKEFQRISNILVYGGSDLRQFLKIILLIVPTVLFVTLPMALMLGVVIGMSRLSHDSEIVAMKSCGISLYRLLVPVQACALFCTAVVFLCTTWLVPKANVELRDMVMEVVREGVAAELKPRVFHDRINNLVFYIEDADPSAALWKGIFIVDKSKNGFLTVHLAREGLVNMANDNLQIVMKGQTTFSLPIGKPESFSLATIGEGVIPFNDIRSIETPPAKAMEKSNAQLERNIAQLRGKRVLTQSEADELVTIEVEYFRRFSLPFACIAFAVLGGPLGMNTRRGGRSAGILFSVVALGLYYLLFVYSWKFAAFSGIFPISVGVWLPNVVFLVFGAMLIIWANKEKRPIEALFILIASSRICSWLRQVADKCTRKYRRNTGTENIVQELKKSTTHFNRIKLINIIDGYILKEFIRVLGISVLLTMVLFTVFTLFELMDYLYKNNIPIWNVLEYFVFVTPMVVLQALPFCILISMLVSFGLLEKTNQILALKSSGISIYRIARPVVIPVLLLVPIVFLLQENILPLANRRQDALYNKFKGRTIQTSNNPVSGWFMGSKGKIYNIGHFDGRQNILDDFWVYEVNLASAELKSVLYIREASWNEEDKTWLIKDGWRRKIGSDGSTRLATYSQRKTKAIEAPAFFSTEVRKADKLSFHELLEHISDLQKKGFNTNELEIELHKKIAYPVVILVMLLLGLPFAFRMGKKGVVFGIAISTVIGIFYWAMFNVFTALGAFGVLPPALAAWAPNLFFATASIYLLFKIRT